MMAGGLGRRMAESGVVIPKPLVPILGVSLLERNLMQLVRMGARQITIAVPQTIPELRHFIETRIRPLLDAVAVSLHVLVESTPLGTIGAVRLMDADTLLVVNADNLTDLDLNAILHAHHEAKATMTTAIHQEPFVLPFAQVLLKDRWVTDYKEKPTFPIDVASAIYVLDRVAIQSIAVEERIGAPTLVERLLKQSQPILGWRHSANWIDVNHSAAVEKATALVSKNAPQFETWGEPDVEVVGALLWSSGQLLLEARSDTSQCYPDIWDTPGGKIETGETPLAAFKREMLEELGLEITSALPLCVFDDVDPHSRKIFRHHVFSTICEQPPRALEGQSIKWFATTSLPDTIAPPVYRSLAWYNQGVQYENI